jgi:ADP-heptose:LPS heptosyltransferase
LKNSLIFLRSFGDFIIALSVLSKAKDLSSFQFIASKHLEPLYKALLKRFHRFPVDVVFNDFHIKHKILGIYTNKHLLHTNNIKEIGALKKTIDELSTKGTVFVEQRRRHVLTSTMMSKHHYVHESGNVYDSYLSLFQVDHDEMFYAPVLNKVRKVLIFPESRKPSKALSAATVLALIKQLQAKQLEVELAFFRSQPYEVPVKVHLHDSFDDLLTLIDQADEIITADSLPAHLAQLFAKPHVIYYAKEVDYEWVTPYARHAKAYGVQHEI